MASKLRESDDNYIKNEFDRMNQSELEGAETIKTKAKNSKTNKRWKNRSQTFSESNRQEYSLSNIDLSNLDSKKMKEPVINKQIFINTILKDPKKKELIDLKLLDFQVLNEILENCGTFPGKYRSFIWKFLLSLPGNEKTFQLYSNKGIHPFYKNLHIIFPIKDKRDFMKLQNMCSLITFWSPHVGNCHFIPNFIFPFIKCIKGDDLFILETIITFLSTFSQYWFEYYPGAPLHHLKICEKIIKNESPNLYKHMKSLEEAQDIADLKLSEIVWRFFKYIFSESFEKESWLQLMDFFICNNHKPEIVLYFACAYIIKSEQYLKKCKDFSDIENVIFNKTSSSKCLKLVQVMKLSKYLMEKYSSYQLYVYKPHVPFIDSYPVIDKFPLDFLQTLASLREELFKTEENYKTKESQINIMETKFKELLNKEQAMQRVYESLIHKEKEKANLIKKELDLILFQKQKYYEEIKLKKLNKIDKLQEVIDTGLRFYDKMSEEELKRYEEEIRSRKLMEEFEIKNRLQQEELNNMEFEANRKMIQLLNLRNKEENDRKMKSEEELLKKDREVMNRLMEEKWNLEDEEEIRKLDNLRNLKEFELVKRKEGNDVMLKDRKEKLLQFEQQLLLQQVERERKQRQIQHELEINKEMVDNQIEKRNEVMKLEEGNYLQKLMNDELGMTKGRRQQHSDQIIKSLKDNMKQLEAEERALMQYEHSLKNKEFEHKIQEIKQKSELRSIEDERIFKDQMLKLEAQKRTHMLKKEENELKKKQIMKNLDKLIEMRNSGEILQEDQQDNFNSFGQNYRQETQNRNENMRNDYSYNSNYNNNYNVNKYNPDQMHDGEVSKRQQQLREQNQNLYNKYLENRNDGDYMDNKYEKGENAYDLQKLNKKIKNYPYRSDDEDEYREDNRDERNNMFSSNSKYYPVNSSKNYPPEGLVSSPSQIHNSRQNNSQNRNLITSGGMSNYNMLASMVSPPKNLNSLGSLSLSATEDY
jgi:hypothetical protein